MRLLAFLLPLLVGAGTTADRPDPASPVDAALVAAAHERRPVLLEFDAPWCHSCYYMAAHVLTGPRWHAVQARARLLVLDADSPDGARWMDRLGVEVLPTYIVLQPDRTEIGRIIGEQVAGKFFPELERILAGEDALDALKSKAEHGSIEATVQALAGYYARDEYGPGLSWYAALTPALRRRAGRDDRVALWRDRLLLRRALARRNQATCIAAAQRVLAGPVGCERYHVLEGLLDCSAKLAGSARKTLLAPQRPALQSLLDREVFVAKPVCADQRTAVLVAAELDAAIGDDRARRAVLDRAIAFARRTLHADYGRDRNLADNLRVYLATAGRKAEYDALLPRLIAAYPGDYVFAYHFGSALLARGEAARALPYLEQAAGRAYGANRLVVAGQRALALLALHRRAEAQKVVADALHRSGPWFPEEAAKLRALLQPS